MPAIFDALTSLPQVARSALYGLLSRRDPFVREAMGGAEPTNEEITGAAGGLPVSGSTLGLGSLLVKNPYEKIGAPLMPKEAVSRAVRSLGRESMEFLRSKIKNFTLRLNPEDAPGVIQYPGDIFVSPETYPLSGFHPRTTLEHEAAHGLYRQLPLKIKEFVQSTADWLRQPDFTSPLEGVSSPYGHALSTTRLEQLRGYPGRFSNASELFAVGSETPTTLPGQMLEPAAKESFNQMRRTLRGMLRSQARKEPTYDVRGNVIGEGPKASATAEKPAWKLSKNAPSWLRRAFETGEREVPLQDVAPKRLPIQSSELVKNPITYELPESADELGALMEQLGGSYGKFPVSGDAPDRTQLQRFMRRR